VDCTHPRPPARPDDDAPLERRSDDRADDDVYRLVYLLMRRVAHARRARLAAQSAAEATR